MSEPYEYSLRDAFGDNIKAEPDICPDPETTLKMVNEENPDGTTHYYGCACGDCVYQYWLLKQ